MRVELQDLEKLPPTLGQRLADEARRIAARRVPIFGWLRALEPVRQRMRAFAGGSGGTRFLRVETPGGATPPAEGEEFEEAGGFLLPPDIRAALRTAVGPEADAVRIHQGADADAVARAHRADAVTTGTEVFFREGRFQPYAREGFALLAHEATHVVASLDPEAARRRATEAGRREEEAAAMAQERTLRGFFPPPAAVVPRPEAPATGLPRPSLGPLPPSPVVPAARPPAAPVTPAPAAMTAAEDRNTGATSAAPIDMEELRRTLYDDLMQRIRTDFERGG